MSPTFRRRPRLAVGCALVALTATLASPAWADPAPTYGQLLAQLDQTPATLEACANSAPS
jgi:outer membrane protein, heavy metal efflux system